MITYTLNIGDVVVCDLKGANFTCYGLGSCIGLFLQDRIAGISGGAHIMLPDNELSSTSTSKFYNVAEAMSEILGQFKKRGSKLTGLRAKIAGGANVMDTLTYVGASNIESVIRHLTSHQIFIAATDVGGKQCRTTKFESTTGNLKVRTPESNGFIIY